jgi:heat shock protein HslJ
LLGHEWIVTKLAGQSVLAEPRITVSFAADARISGSASCNRFGAEYQLTGEGLRIGNPMSSMMACEPPVMEQEQLFLGLLEKVARFSIEMDGALVLHTNDERTIVMVKP